MTQISSGPRSLLSVPFLYRAFIRSLGGEKARSEFVRTYLRPRAGDRILDIGCGPGTLLAYLPAVSYVGFDVNASYIRDATRHFGDRGRFLHRTLGERGPVPGAPFDLAVAFGVLHHLADAEADALFREARSALRPGGRLVTLDGAWAQGQSRAAAWVIARDRGRNVRSAEDLVAIAERTFDGVRASVRSDLLWIPYTHVILECQAGGPPGL